MKTASHFFVSARKYRPTSFEDVVGQAHVTRTLQNAIQRKQLPQALLFCGPHGVGKTTCARILACAVNRFETQDPTRPLSDLYTFELDAASYNSVDNIRNLVEQVRFPPPKGKRKVYIIDEVHMLSTQAFNAFLKTLEEPPAYALFILATTEKHKVLPTILSRCQIFDFRRIDMADIVANMLAIAQRERTEVSEEALYIIARKADGSMRDALSMYDMLRAFSERNKLGAQEVAQVLHVLTRDVYFSMSEHLLSGDIARALSLLEEVSRKGTNLLSFVVDMQLHLRDLLLAKHAESFALLEMGEEGKRRYTEKTAQYPTSFLVEGLEVLAQCEQAYKGSKHVRLWVEISLAKLAHRGVVTQTQHTEGKDADTTPSNDAHVVRPARVECAPQRASASSLEASADTPPQADTVSSTKERDLSGDGLSHKATSLLAAYRQELANKEKDAVYYALETASCVTEGNRIYVLAKTAQHEKALHGIRDALDVYIKKGLHKEASVHVAVADVKKPRTREKEPYTSAEKYRHLAEKYPNIKGLVDQLGFRTEDG